MVILKYFENFGWYNIEKMKGKDDKIYDLIFNLLEIL